MPATRVVAPLALLLACALAPAARAATYAPASTQDGVHGACTPAVCSLRDAVQAADASPGDDVVVLAAGSYRLTTGGRGEDAAATGDLDVADAAASGSLEVRGAGARTTTIDASGLAGGDRIFDVLRGGALALSHLALTGGNAGDDQGGGAVAVVGATSSLTASEVTMAGNAATTADGGYGGGGALQTAGTTTLDRVTLSGNRAAGDGGALLQDGGDLTVTNATLAGNRVDTSLAPDQAYAAVGGAAELGGDSATLTGVTVVGNAIDDPDGGTGRSSAIEVDPASRHAFAGLLVAGNTASPAITAADPGAARACAAPLQAVPDTPADLDDDGSCFAGTGALHAAPRLGPLGANGGETDTVPLLAGSPGVDAGASAGLPATDQRGAPRVGAPDLGAYESPAGGGSGTPGAGAPGTSGGPGSASRPAPTRVSLAVAPRRDRTRPFRFAASGRVSLPAGVSAARGCRGRVSVELRSGGRVLATRTVTLRTSCRYAATLRLPAARRGRVRASFRGNAALRPRASRVVAVRAGAGSAV